jgi:hypothetical protein
MDNIFESFVHSEVANAINKNEHFVIDNLKIKKIGSYIDNSGAYVSVEIENLPGENNISENMNLLFDNDAYICTPISYDENNKTASFGIKVEFDGQKLLNEEINLGINKILLGAEKINSKIVTPNINDIIKNGLDNNTISFDEWDKISSIGNERIYKTGIFESTVSDNIDILENSLFLPIKNNNMVLNNINWCTVGNVGFIDNMFHLQSDILPTT